MKPKSICYLLATLSIGLLVSSCSDKPAPSGGTASGEKPSASKVTISKGEMYRAIDDKMVVKMISSSEVEISEKDGHFVGQYSRDGGRLRATLEVLGTKQAVYFDIIPDGLRDEDGVILYRPDRYEVVMREVGAKRKQEALNKQLLDAAMSGDLTNATAAVQGGAQATAADSAGNTPLHLASKGGYPDLVKLLLEKGANPKLRAREMMTPLHLATDVSGDLRFFKGDHKPEHDQIVSLLLQAGAEIDAQEERGLTALLFAVLRGNPEAAKILLAAGADRKVRDKAGKSVFDYAKEDPHKRALIRTAEEAKLFEESRSQTKATATYRDFLPQPGYEADYQTKEVILTDVGLVFFQNSGEQTTYLFSDFEGEPVTIDGEFAFKGHYWAQFPNFVFHTFTFKTAAERDAFFKASKSALEEWRKKYANIP